MIFCQCSSLVSWVFLLYQYLLLQCFPQILRWLGIRPLKSVSANIYIYIYIYVCVCVCVCVCVYVCRGACLDSSVYGYMQEQRRKIWFHTSHLLCLRLCGMSSFRFHSKPTLSINMIIPAGNECHNLFSRRLTSWYCNLLRSIHLFSKATTTTTTLQLPCISFDHLVFPHFPN